LRGTKVVVVHDSWAYFAERFGLQIVAAAEPHPGIPPSPAELAMLFQRMRESKVRVLIADPHANLALVKQIKEKGGPGALLTGVGLCASWSWDLPAGPAIVAAFSAATALVAIGAAVRHLTRRKAGIAACGLAILIGFPLAAFPQMDQPWLDALEEVAPALQTGFLTPSERATRGEAIQSVGRALAELARLSALNQDVLWGRVEMEPEKAERLRQYLMGKSELSAGDQLVLHHLRSKARERQRFALGIPLALAGAGGLYAILRRRRLRRLPLS
jgi:hypothetical protein